MLELKTGKEKEREKSKLFFFVPEQWFSAETFCSPGHLTLFSAATARKEVPLASTAQRPRMPRALPQCTAQDGAHAREISDD